MKKLLLIFLVLLYINFSFAMTRKEALKIFELPEEFDIKNEDDKRSLTTQYKKRALQWHPDKNRGNEQEADNMFKKIVSAMECLRENKCQGDPLYRSRQSRPAPPDSLGDYLHGLTIMIFNLIFLPNRFYEMRSYLSITEQNKDLWSNPKNRVNILNFLSDQEQKIINDFGITQKIKDVTISALNQQIKQNFYQLKLSPNTIPAELQKIPVEIPDLNPDIIQMQNLFEQIKESLYQSNTHSLTDLIDTIKTQTKIFNFLDKPSLNTLVAFEKLGKFAQSINFYPNLTQKKKVS